MGNLNYTCEIFTLPFGFACLAKDLFVMPCSARLFPLLDSDAKKAKDMFSLLEKNPTPAALKSVNLIGSSQEDLTYDILPHELQVATQQFVTCLHQMFQMMSVKEDVFTVGSFSRVLGQQLDQLPQAKHRRKTALNKASVILIDRTLDLSTPSKTSFKTILDKIKAMLPEFPGHRNDVQIEMGPLFGMKSDSAETETFCGGCLANSFHLKKTEATASWLDKFVMADEENKVVKDLHTELCEALQITPNKKKVTTSHLERDILGFKDDYEVIKANLDTIQRASALVQAGKNSEKTREFEQLAQLQAHFRQEIGDEKAVQGYLAKMVKLVRGRKEKQLDLESVLLLLVNIYSLLPPGLEFFPEDEDRLQSVISEAIVQEKDDLGQILQSMTKGMKVDEILAHQMVKKIFLKLNAISRARDKLQSYQDLTEEDDGFLKRVMSDVFADDRRTVADLEHQSQGLGSMLKSGIGFFGVNMTKMHPRENPTLFIFVVGGLTAREVKEMKDLISSRSKCKVVVGSTKLTSPADCLRSLFVENPLLTD